MSKSWVAILIAAMFGLSAVPASADVKLPSLFTDHMVVQRDKSVMVWGWADPGEAIAVSVDGKSLNEDTAFKSVAVKTKASRKGRWIVTLQPFPEENVCSIRIVGKNTVTIKDVLVGEVWVCSGQSNMQWSVAASDNPQEEIANADHPHIRLFHVPRKPAGVPVKDVQAKWEVCSPKTVSGFSAVAYYFGRQLNENLKTPIGLIHTSWGGTRIEPWTPPEGFASVPETRGFLLNTTRAHLNYIEQLESGRKESKHGLNSHTQPTGLYNGMVAPLVPYSIRGAIWYQGESNRGDGLAYEQKMHALINGWRQVWGQGDFPFYYVQLAPYRYRGDSKLLPLIWEAQTNVLKMKNTGMAVTVDVGNVRDIHPRNKQAVGKRLALWALAKDYGRKDLVYSGPLYKSHKVEDGAIRVEFDHTGSGLVSRDDKSLSWFEVAGKDGKYVKADAKVDGKNVVVSSGTVSDPLHVRFGWDELAEPNLSNKEGLPASPFRTDRGK